MASPSPSPPLTTAICPLLFLLLTALAAITCGASNFYRHFDVTWGGGRGRILGNGELLTLSLDRVSGSGVRSKKEFLFGKIDMQLKLVPGNSAGTVTALYMASEGYDRDEIDYEFLGNVSGQPYTIHTNVYMHGRGDREQEFRLWFDPTTDFHTYSVLWNPHHIIFLVDGTPIRDFANHEDKGLPFPKSKPMRVYSSIWNADDWATRGGLVKTDWSKAPFVVSCRGFQVDACVRLPGGRTQCSSKHAGRAWLSRELDSGSQQRMKWVRDKYMIYDYCADRGRFPQGPAPECYLD